MLRGVRFIAWETGFLVWFDGSGASGASLLMAYGDGAAVKALGLDIVVEDR